MNNVYCLKSHSERIKVQGLLDRLKKEYAVKFFPETCETSNNQEKECGSNVQCWIRTSHVLMVLEPTSEEKMIMEHIYYAISVNTAVLYYWKHSLDDFLPQSALYMTDYDNPNDMDFISERMDINQLQIDYEWKNSTLPDPLQKALSQSKASLYCRVCAHLTLKKEATQSMLQLLDQAQSLPTVSEYLNETIQGLGFLQNVTDGVFVPHYSKSQGRRKHLSDLTASWGTNAIFVDDFDREDISDMLMNSLVSQSKPGDYRQGFHPSPLRPGEVSLAVKMFWIYLWIIQNNEHSALILEDDIEFKNANVTTLVQAIEMLPPNYSLCHFGSGYFSAGDYYMPYPGGLNHRKLYPSIGKTDHCTGAYIISKQGAILMFKSLPLITPIDFQMNDNTGMEHPDFNVYGVWPPLFIPSVGVNRDHNTGIRLK